MLYPKFEIRKYSNLYDSPTFSALYFIKACYYTLYQSRRLQFLPWNLSLSLESLMSKKWQLFTRNQ